MDAGMEAPAGVDPAPPVAGVGTVPSLGMPGSVITSFETKHVPSNTEEPVSQDSHSSRGGGVPHGSTNMADEHGAAWSDELTE